MDSAAINGVGVGLRPAHYADIFQLAPQTVPWFEVLADNFIIGNGMPLTQLRRISEAHPIVFHSVNMSLGSPEPFDPQYLGSIRRLGREIGVRWYSDHLCFSKLNGVSLNDLLPLPYTEECVISTAKRIRQTQDFLESRLLIENVSKYFQYQNSSMTEWEFLAAVSEEADCDILLDVNNIYVNSVNQAFDPDAFLNHIPAHRVRQFHLAGYTQVENHLIDTHGAAVSDPVWQLYQRAVQRFGSIPTLIEWDNNVPSFATLLEEKSRAEAILKCASGAAV